MERRERIQEEEEEEERRRNKNRAKERGKGRQVALHHAARASPHERHTVSFLHPPLSSDHVKRGMERKKKKRRGRGREEEGVSPGAQSHLRLAAHGTIKTPNKPITAHTARALCVNFGCHWVSH